MKLVSEPVVYGGKTEPFKTDSTKRYYSFIELSSGISKIIMLTGPADLEFAGEPGKSLVVVTIDLSKYKQKDSNREVFGAEIVSIDMHR